MSLSVVTGANRGIGLELCRQLAARGASVIGVCRTPSQALETLGVEVIGGVDVGSDECVDALRTGVGTRAIALLINNAGVFLSDTLAGLDARDIHRQFEVNSVGPLRVTHALLDNLEVEAKIAIITSRMGSIEDNTSGGYYGYRMSKAAVNAAGRSLAVDLRPKRVAVGIFHPGYVRTDMTGWSGNIEVSEAARGLLARIDELSMATTGRFFHANGEELPW